MTSNNRDIHFNFQHCQSTPEPGIKMSVSIKDREEIFLAYRPLFEGQKAQVRNPKTIRKILNLSKNTSSPFMHNVGFDAVVSTVKGLLEEGVFSSELKARLAFPALYQTSREQDARHEASDAGAAREEAEALQEVKALDDATVEGAGDEAFAVGDDGLLEEGGLPAGVERLQERNQGKPLGDTCELERLEITQGIQTQRKSRRLNFHHSIRCSSHSGFSTPY